MNSTPRTAPLIDPRLGSLFTGDGTESFAACLPFVSAEDYWNVPADPEPGVKGRDSELGLAFARGKRYAAAYFIFVMRNGPDELPLGHIVDAMANAETDSGATQQTFWYHLTRLFWLYGHQVSAVQIADNVEAVILQDEALHFTDLERLAGL